MKKTLYFFFSIFTWLIMVVLALIFMPFQLLLFFLTVLFDKHRRLMHYHGSLYVTLALMLTPIMKLKIEGWENLDRSKSHVVIMNHQSLIDILLVFRLFYPVKMIGKKILAMIPIVGWDIFLAGHIFVDRSSRKSQFRAIRRMEKILKTGDSLLVFPEGTRTTDGEIQKFRRGGFRAATETGTPVLPVVIDGAFQALPKSTVTVDRKHTVRISIMPPVPVEEKEDMGELAGRCQQLMTAELARMRSENLD